MNRWIAQCFSLIVSAIHITVIIVLITSIIAYFSSDINERQQLAHGLSDFAVIISFVGAFCIYVIIMGAISTLIAINENIERLNETILSSRVKPHESASTNRTEPRLRSLDDES